MMSGKDIAANGQARQLGEYRSGEQLTPGLGSLQILPPKRYCPHVPTPKQLAFLLCPRCEAFFGGAAGPGKTEGLLMGALQLVEYPGYHGLLLRRTFRQLNQANSLIKRARQWLANTDAVWNNSDKRFSFPSGATISFAIPINNRSRI
jgi:hypothetical protein